MALLQVRIGWRSAGGSQLEGMIVFVVKDDLFGSRHPGRSRTYPMIFAARAISRSNRLSIAMASVTKDDYHTGGCAVEVLPYSVGRGTNVRALRELLGDDGRAHGYSGLPILQLPDIDAARGEGTAFLGCLDLEATVRKNQSPHWVRRAGRSDRPLIHTKRRNDEQAVSSWCAR
jgi:hypothetical protein